MILNHAFTIIGKAGIIRANYQADTWPPLEAIFNFDLNSIRLIILQNSDKLLLRTSN